MSTVVQYLADDAIADHIHFHFLRILFPQFCGKLLEVHGVLLDYFTKKNRTGACCMFLESPDPTGFKKCEIEIPAVRFFLGGF